MRPQSNIRTLVTQFVVGCAGLLLFGTVLVGIAPDGLPPLTAPPTKVPTATPLPAPDLEVGALDIVLSPLLAEGEPFTATITVHNRGDLAAERARVAFNIVQLTGTREQNIYGKQALVGPIAPGTTLVVSLDVPAEVPLKPGSYLYQATASVVAGPNDRNPRNNAAPTSTFAMGTPLARCATQPDLALEQSDVRQDGDTIVIAPRNLGATTLYDVDVLVRYLDPDGPPERHYPVRRLLPCGGTTLIKAYRLPGRVEVSVQVGTAEDGQAEASQGNNVVELRVVAP